MLPDLPLFAVKRITDLARGRTISGTNRLAPVCRQWRDAGCSSDEAEQLRLYLDVCNMSVADFGYACSWMSLHGTQLDVLIVDAQTTAPERLDAFVRLPADALRNLTWLRVLQPGSLALLAPMLEQLPHLRHLSAGVWLGFRDKSDASEADGEPAAAGVFCDQRWTRWSNLPDMGHLCAQLTHLHLTLDAQGCDLTVDPRLPELLPANLQQLSLGASRQPTGVHPGSYVSVTLQPSSLAHLSALRELKLGSGLDGDGSEAVAIMESLPALQQLHPYLRDPGDPILVPLAPVLAHHVMDGDHGAQDLQVLSHLTRLTSLRVYLRYPAEGVRLPQGLTGLQELVLDVGRRVDVRDLLNQAAGISSLHTLDITRVGEDLAAVMARLALCTENGRTAPGCPPSQTSPSCV
jgi:hypothetical protein